MTQAFLGRSWVLPPKQKEGDEVVELHYSERPSAVEGSSATKLGRYIGWTPAPSDVDHVDEHAVIPQVVHEGRGNADLTLATTGFELVKFPAEEANSSAPQCFFSDDADADARETYYKAAADVIRKAYEKAGQPARKVVIFDHTRRSTQVEATRLNPLSGAEDRRAAPVNRVHCDYTKESAPRRLAQLASLKKKTKEGEDVSREDADAALAGRTRYAFVNLWQSTDREHPVKRSPLAFLDPRGLDVDDRAKVMIYELCYADRVGENYALDPDAAPDLTWHYFREVTADEAVVFSVFDSDVDRPGFVFHTAFDVPPPLRDPFDLSPQVDDPDLPHRQSIEVRAIVFFE